MSDYILSCCSTADLSKEHFEKRDIHYICFSFELEGKHYKDDLGQSIPFDDFYEAMANGASTKTSQVNVDEFIEYFTPFLERGEDIIHVSLSSGISGVYNSAMVAREELAAKYPDRKIYIIDSLGASSGYGLLMETMADLRDSGMGIDELREWVEQHKLEMHHWFFSTDLKYYVRGGRISKSAGMVGTILSICPLLNMDNAGKLIPRSMVRTKRRVIQEIVKRMEEHVKDGINYAGKCFISNAHCLEDAKAVAQLVEDKFKNLNGRVVINSVGTTIGSHTGPGTVALFFWGDPRIA